MSIQRSSLCATLIICVAFASPAVAAEEKAVEAISNRAVLDAARSALDANDTSANWLSIGYILSRAGDRKMALQAFIKAAAIDPKSAEAQNAIAVEYYHLGNTADELTHYAKALLIDPDYVDALTNRASTHVDQKKWDLAIADYRAAIEIDPGRASYYTGLGEALASAGNAREAGKAHAQAVRRNPKSGGAWRAQGTFQADSGKLGAAIASYGRAIVLDAADSVALVGRAKAYARLSKFMLATGDFEAAAKAAPDSTFVRNEYGNYLSDYREDYQAAIGQFDRALAIDPKDSVVLYNRALAYKSLSREDRALRDIAAALGLTPGDADIWMQRGDMYRRLGDHLLAVEYLDKAIALNPELAKAIRWRGLARAELGDAAGAAADAKEADRIDAASN